MGVCGGGEGEISIPLQYKTLLFLKEGDKMLRQTSCKAHAWETCFLLLLKERRGLVGSLVVS